MATVHKQFKIDAPADQVWAKMSDLSGVHFLFGMLENATLDGDTRTCTIAEGGELKELMVSVDPELKRLVYSIVESPFGFSFHSASWQAIPDGEGTIFEWYTDVKPDAAASMLVDVIDNERENIIRGLSQ